MSNNIRQLNQELIHSELKDLVRNSVEETLNALLDHEAEELVNAENTSVLMNVRVIAPVIIIEISRRHPVMKH